tara:strand:- start:1520 stop:1930 length:411 start_codon:yes stop_codon:yes gene_type:complete
MKNYNELFPNAKETRQFLNKFDGFTIESSEKESVTFTNGIKISYSIKISSSVLYQMTKNPIHRNKHAMPMQVLVRVEMNGEYVEMWGCGSHDDNNLILVWFQLKRNEGRVIESLLLENANKEYLRLLLENHISNEE